MFKRESIVGIFALVVILLGSYVAAYFGVKIDLDYIVAGIIPAIAALIRGGGGQRDGDK
jgi:small neutral amino acid transporter SnatA (MarC family)